MLLAEGRSSAPQLRSGPAASSAPARPVAEGSAVRLTTHRIEIRLGFLRSLRRTPTFQEMLGSRGSGYAVDHVTGTDPSRFVQLSDTACT